MFKGMRRSLRRFTDHLIESPCIAVCKMDERRAFCTGCFRSLDEISNWSRFTGAEKKMINRTSAERKTAAAKSQ